MTDLHDLDDVLTEAGLPPAAVAELADVDCAAVAAAALAVADYAARFHHAFPPPRPPGRVWMHAPPSFDARLRDRLAWLLGYHSPSLSLLGACPCTRCALRRWGLR